MTTRDVDTSWRHAMTTASRLPKLARAANRRRSTSSASHAGSDPPVGRPLLREHPGARLKALQGQGGEALTHGLLGLDGVEPGVLVEDQQGAGGEGPHRGARRLLDRKSTRL